MHASVQAAALLPSEHQAGYAVQVHRCSLSLALSQRAAVPAWWRLIVSGPMNAKSTDRLHIPQKRQPLHRWGRAPRHLIQLPTQHRLRVPRRSLPKRLARDRARPYPRLSFSFEFPVFLQDRHPCSAISALTPLVAYDQGRAK